MAVSLSAAIEVARRSYSRSGRQNSPRPTREGAITTASGLAIHEQSHARLNLRSNVGDSRNRGNTQRPGNDGRVAECPSVFGDDRDHSGLREFDGFRRQQFAGNDDRSRRQRLVGPRRRTRQVPASSAVPRHGRLVRVRENMCCQAVCKRSTKSRITASSACSTLTNSRPMCCLTIAAISFAIAEWADNSAAESTSLGSLRGSLLD